jgi:hypothetical protein
MVLLVLAKHCLSRMNQSERVREREEHTYTLLLLQPTHCLRAISNLKTRACKACYIDARNIALHGMRDHELHAIRSVCSSQSTACASILVLDHLESLAPSGNASRHLRYACALISTECGFDRLSKWLACTTARYQHSCCRCWTRCLLATLVLCALLLFEEMHHRSIWITAELAGMHASQTHTHIHMVMIVNGL